MATRKVSSQSGKTSAADLARKKSLRMAAVDAELEANLDAQTASGLLDIKCHIEVSRNTRPEDFRRALLNVFKREEEQLVRAMPMSKVGSFDQLVKFVLG